MYCVFLKLQTCFKKTNIIGVTINIVALNKISDLAATVVSVVLSPLNDETTFSLELAFSSGQQTTPDSHRKRFVGFYKVVIHNVEVGLTGYAVKEINCQLIFSPSVNSVQVSFINVVQSRRLHITYNASVGRVQHNLSRAF